MSVKSTILWGWGPVLPQPLSTSTPTPAPTVHKKTLKISGLYSLLLRALITTKELAGKRPACLRSMHRPSTPSQILLCSPGLQSLLLWPISPSSLLFAAISPSSSSLTLVKLATGNTQLTKEVIQTKWG